MDRPEFHTEESRNYPKSVWINRPTYRELKKDLPALLEEYEMEEATVFRFRRGEWGEWFEKFYLVPGKKPKVRMGKSGWM